jgi:catalase
VVAPAWPPLRTRRQRRASDEHSLTVGPNGPTVLHDHYVVQKMQHFNRERIPSASCHAKGSGAHGFFEVTEDVTQWTKAAFLNKVGKRTPMFAALLDGGRRAGRPDTVRDPRGFALKFYTEEGNYDLVGNNTPVFFVRDAMKFSDFIHSQKRMPDTGMRSNDMQWDFWTLSPESAHQVAILMSDRGTPRTWRNMNGYAATRTVDERRRRALLGQVPLQDRPGRRELHARRGHAMAVEDPTTTVATCGTRSPRGLPEWRLEMQIMPFEDAADYRFNPFDLTKVWPHADYPPIPIGRMVLDRNPANHFAEVEQARSRPANSSRASG